MSRWRSSLAVLGRIGSIEAQAPGSSSVLLGSFIPDFLAPSLQPVTRHARRPTASLASAALEHSATNSSQDSAATSSSSTKKIRMRATRDRQTTPPRYRTRNIDFSSYFDADVPKPSSSTSINKAFHLPCSDKKGAAYIRMRLDTAKDESDLARSAQGLYRSSALLAERESVSHAGSDTARNADEKTAALELNEFFLLSLAQTSYAITRRTGSNGLDTMDGFVGRYLRQMCKDVPHSCFSDRFLSRLAREAGRNSQNSTNQVLNLLFDIVQQRLSQTAAVRSSAEGPVNTNGSQASSTSQVLFHLMQSFSHIGRSDAVKGCFDLLKRHSLPVSVFHYQLQLIALFRERTSDLADKDQGDIERESNDIQTSILAIKTMMEADGVTLDDTALATMVNGLGAPLRNPLAEVSSVAQAKSALGMVRTVFDQFASQKLGDAFESMPRLVSSLINAEIDALQRDQSLTSRAQEKVRERIQRFIQRLESRAASSQSPVVGSLDGTPFTEKHLACAYLQLRLHAVLGEADRGLEQLRLLLSVKPLVKSDSSIEARRELILKQRSGVVNLFSAMMQRRRDIAGQDAAFEVLQRAFSTTWFDRVWTGAALPSNLGAGVELKAYDPDASVLRLWTRWIHAWSADYQAEGTKRGDGGVGKHELKYRTFTGSYPWQTLKRGLRLLNKVIDQYEALEPTRRVPRARNDQADPKPAARIAAFASTFTDACVLDSIVKLCLRGGRPAPNETMATHVERRLTLLIRTLTRVYAPARTWEHVERCMLRHLALIPREVLPTAAVKDAMDQIEKRKQLALLRNPELVKALDARVEGGEAPETGSIFVLRQMLRQREVQHSLNKPTTATQPKPAFT